MMVSLCLSSSPHPSSIPSPQTLISPSISPTNSPLYIKFRTSHREDLRYLKTLGLIPPNSKPPNWPSPETADQLLTRVNFLKSKGFSDTDFPRIAFLVPQLFSPELDPAAHIEPVLDFLTNELSASTQESCGLITKCPKILFSDVDYCLRPTVKFLKQLGVEKLNLPTTLNAHLLDTRVEKLKEKIKFLRSIGFTYQESARICARLPAIFGYSVENNLRPKLEYLVEEMGRSLEELDRFPQYFGFSLERRIAPRHLHLKQRNVRIPLNRMLLWGDKKFYTKWK